MAELDTNTVLLQAVKQLLESQQGGQVRKTISGIPDYQSVFGQNGFFANLGIDNAVINTSMQPRGLDGLIPAIGTQIIQPIYPFITGFEDDGGSEPAGVCDDAPGGVIEVCHQTAQAGRYSRGSKEMEVNELMLLANNNLTTDLRVIGQVLGPGHPLLPTNVAGGEGWIRSAVAVQMVIIGVLLQRLLTRQLWQGNPANNNVGGGYKEFPGLDILISTGKVDAISGVACGALDSDIKEFNYNSIDGTNPDIVTWLSSMMYYLEHVADRTGLGPVDYAIAMRPQLFFELTAVWPCRYMTNRCADSAGANVVVLNDSTYINMRDALRNGMYLVINGKNYPVVLDDGIYEHDSQNSANLNPGEFASDIYVIPLRARGMPVLYWEYYDYSKIATTDLAVLQGKQQFWQTDGGRWLWTLQQRTYCFKWQGKCEPRVVLRTPQLAGRIQNVMYTPLQHLREPFQDSPYFKKGGKEDYTLPTELYSEWNPRQ